LIGTRVQFDNGIGARIMELFGIDSEFGIIPFSLENTIKI